MSRRAIWVAGMLVCFSAMGRGLAEDEPARVVLREIREFRVRVDGQPAGRCRLTTIHYGTHVLSVTAAYGIEVQGGPAVLYRYRNQDRETWKDGRLERLESQGQEDGHPFAVRAARTGGSFHIEFNGQANRATLGMGTTACWLLPASCPEDGILPLIDGATGQQVGIHFRYLGADRLSVGNRTNECRHFELAGPRLRQAWYDGLDRLVRQEQDINGHHLVLELVRVH